VALLVLARVACGAGVSCAAGVSYDCACSRSHRAIIAAWVCSWVERPLRPQVMMPVKIAIAPIEMTLDGACITAATNPHKVAAAMARILMRPLRSHCDIGYPQKNSTRASYLLLKPWRILVGGEAGRPKR
jgi:hypothetical protein